ncbi:MAG: response regulator [Candidatus Eremiobacteraeota bacterium]|nr:response regulator [Candidatus Eremiobacteraeota bacterium]
MINPVERAQEALAKFGVRQVDIWLIGEPGAMPMLAARAANDAESALGSSPSAIRDRIAAAAPVFEGERFGAPLVGEAGAFGYVEFFNAQKLSLGVAAQLEAWCDDIALAFSAQRAAHDLESPSRGSILVADDDANIRRLLLALLERRGFHASAVGNGADACERAIVEHPDLILLDYRMPILDGRDTAIRLRSDPRTRDIPIIMVTAQSGTEEKVAALEAGAQDYVTKPFEPEELIARIASHLRWRSLFAEPEAPAAAAPATPPAAAAPATPPAAAAPAAPPAAPSPVETGEDALWLAASHAEQLGRYADALNLYLEEAERAEHRSQYARAAIAFRSASTIAGRQQHADLSNKLLRLSGKMYLTLAEESKQGNDISDAYVNAAKCFLLAGNLQLAKKSVSIAESMTSVIADDRPSSLS